MQSALTVWCRWVKVNVHHLLLNDILNDISNGLLNHVSNDAQVTTAKNESPKVSVEACQSNRRAFRVGAEEAIRLSTSFCTHSEGQHWRVSIRRILVWGNGFNQKKPLKGTQSKRTAGISHHRNRRQKRCQNCCQNRYSHSKVLEGILGADLIGNEWHLLFIIFASTLHSKAVLVCPALNLKL